jgi:chorismate mutase
VSDNVLQQVAIHPVEEEGEGMTSPSRGSGDTAAAQRLVDAIARRAALHEAVGIMRAWGGDDVLERLCDQHSDAEREAEIARVSAVVDAAAEQRADPDWGD